MKRLGPTPVLEKCRSWIPYQVPGFDRVRYALPTIKPSKHDNSDLASLGIMNSWEVCAQQRL